MSRWRARPPLLAGADPADLAADLADGQAAADPDPNVVVTAVCKRMLTALSTCEDFTGDVATAANAVMDQLIKFVRQRLNVQESSKPYVFDEHANEHAVHVDLYEWLGQGQLGSATNVEVQEVGAGRVHIQIEFAGFPSISSSRQTRPPCRLRRSLPISSRPSPIRPPTSAWVPRRASADSAEGQGPVGAPHRVRFPHDRAAH